MYNLDTYDHVMRMHFHYPLNMTISICLQLVVKYASHIQLVVPLSCHSKSYTFTLFCDYCSIVLSLIFHYIVTYNIMSE
jgi:hypothetical protein